MDETCWIPPEIFFEDFSDWFEYENNLYEVFVKDFIDSRPLFENAPVAVKKSPYENGKENAFFHLTNKNYNLKLPYNEQDRQPDLRRCERISWIRAFIENYQCNPSMCSECEGVKVWREPYKSNRERVHLLLEEEKYMVILEDRKEYFLLITAYYLDYEHSLKKQLKNYYKYR